MLPIWTQKEIVDELVEATGLKPGEIRNVLSAQEDLVLSAIKNCERIKVANVVQLEPKLRKAQKARMGRNPQTGEPVKVKAKPESVRVAARILKPAKTSAPTTRKLKAALNGA